MLVPTAIRFDLWLQATDVTSCEWPFNWCSCSPVRALQRMAVVSKEPVAILVPSGLQATDFTGPESYVDDMLRAADMGFFPVLKTSSIIVEDVSNESLRERIDTLTQRVLQSHERLEAQLEAGAKQNSGIA